MVGANVQRSSTAAVSFGSRAIQPKPHVGAYPGFFRVFAAGKQSGALAGICLNFAGFTTGQLRLTAWGYFSTRGPITHNGS